MIDTSPEDDAHDDGKNDDEDDNGDDRDDYDDDHQGRGKKVDDVDRTITGNNHFVYSSSTSFQLRLAPTTTTKRTSVLDDKRPRQRRF